MSMKQPKRTGTDRAPSFGIGDIYTLLIYTIYKALWKIIPGYNRGKHLVAAAGVLTILQISNIACIQEAVEIENETKAEIETQAQVLAWLGMIILGFNIYMALRYNEQTLSKKFAPLSRKTYIIQVA